MAERTRDRSRDEGRIGSSRRDDDEDRGSRTRLRDDDRSRDRDDDRGGRSRDRDREDDRGGRGRDRDDDRSERRSSRGRDDDDDRGSRRGSGSSYTYTPRSTEQQRKRENMKGGDFDKFLADHIKTWKPNDGDNRIRILPPTWKGAEHFGIDLYVHYGIGADRQSYLDLDKMKGEADPITEARAEAQRDGDEEYAKQLRSTRRVLVYLIDRDHPKEGVQAWAMPQNLDRDIVMVTKDKGTGEVLPIDDPENGYDVEFRKTGQGMKTEYLGVQIARRSNPLGDDRWLDYAVENPLPDQLVYFDYDHIAKVFGGGGSKSGRGDRDRDEDRGGRGRDDDRSRDRDEDRGGRGRERDRGDDDRGGRGREREERGGGRSRSSEPEAPTWESVHEMTKSELEDLVEAEKLDIKPKEAKDTEDLADWVCEEMKLKKSTRRVESRGDDDGDDKLARMRRDRD